MKANPIQHSTTFQTAGSIKTKKPTLSAEKLRELAEKVIAEETIKRSK